MSAAKATEVTSTRKITPKAIMGGRPTLVNGKKTDLCSIAGVARRCESVNTTFGESIRFIGDFIAVNLQTGEVFRANRAFFPKVVEGELESAVRGNGNVEFAFKISIIPDADSATGYVYHAEPVQKVRESDQVAALAEKIGVNLLAEPHKNLPAPAKSETGKQTDKASDKGKGK